MPDHHGDRLFALPHNILLVGERTSTFGDVLAKHRCGYSSIVTLLLVTVVGRLVSVSAHNVDSNSRCVEQRVN